MADIFITDGHGLAKKPKSIKAYKLLHGQEHSWAMKVPVNLKPTDIAILTYSLPKIDFIKDFFNKREHLRFRLVCHDKFNESAYLIHRHCSNVEVRVNNQLHSKLCLYNDTVYLGSLNFGRNKMIESVIGIKDADIANFYRQDFEIVWASSFGFLEPTTANH